MRHVAYDITAVTTWACWAVMGLTWAAGAVHARRRRPAGAATGAARDTTSLAGTIAAVAVLLSPAWLWRPLGFGPGWLRLAGGVILVVATAGAVWARLALGATWSSAPAAAEGLRLCTTGPYRITRHPIYTAILGMLAGTALTQGLGRWAAIAAVIAVMLAVKIRAEERILTQMFPHEYACYQRQVPQLIPRPRQRRT